MTEHTPTPGPWRNEGDGWVAVDSPYNNDLHGHGVPICTVRGAQHHQIDANANLIAAAPKLLEALICVRETCLYTDDDGRIAITYNPEISDELFNQICAVIAKATGETA